MAAVYDGLLLGLFLSVFVGATFFVLIETGINRGFKPALAMNLGVFTSDISIILIAYFSTSDFLNNLVNNHLFKLAGGIAFFGFGGYYILKKHNTKNILMDTSSLNYTRLFFNGMLINTLNPSVIAFWLGSIVLIVSYNNFSGHQAFVFYLSCMCVVISLDLTKIYFASKLKKFITLRILKIISVVTGILFILLSLKIIFFS